jgi:hypothetical protein
MLDRVSAAELTEWVAHFRIKAEEQEQEEQKANDPQHFTGRG